MRLTRIIIALTAGLAVVATPVAAGAAQPAVPQPPQPTTTPADPPQPPYPPQPAALTLSRNTITLGETVRLNGRYFGPVEWADIAGTVAPLTAAAVPGEQAARRSDGSTVAMAPVALQAAAPIGWEARTDESGSFTTTYKPTQTGKITFVVTGRGSGRTASATLTVLAAADPEQPPLPVTGSSLSTPLAVGGGLVAVGAVLFLGSMAWRRRRADAGAAH